MTAGLSNAEAQFVYNVEVLGLPTMKAAQLADLPYSASRSDRVLAARAVTKREVAASVQITKDDVLRGIKGAIDRAQIIAEPSTEIRGWEVINKMLGFDAPTQIDVRVQGTIETVQRQVKNLSDDQLVKMLGAGDVIDGAFYVVNKPA